MKSLKELFQKLNDVEYVVLRNWEKLPFGMMPGHEDIDILTSDSMSVVALLDAKKTYSEDFRVQYIVKINGQDQLIDIRTVGDNYYPKKFEKKLLKRRKFNGLIYIPHKDDAFHALLYHALVHKNHINADYLERFKEYVSEKVGGITKPNDLSVNFNIKDLIYNRSNQGTTANIEILWNLGVPIVKKTYFKEYQYCLDYEVAAFERLKCTKHFPQLLNYDNNSITMSYCGDHLTCFNLPNNWSEQVEEIIDVLKESDIVHRDITPLNLHVSFGIIKLIDFGWATTFANKNSKVGLTSSEWQNLGLLWRKPVEFDDSYSLIQVLSEFYLQKLGKVRPKAEFANKWHK